MQLLLDLKPQRLLWSKYYSTWRALLAGENFCTPSRFDLFQRGASQLTRLEVKAFGVSAVVGLGKLPPKNRALVIEKVRKWSRGFKQPLSHKAYQTFILEQRSLLGAGHEQNYPSAARLMKYIRSLEAKLKEHGIRLPAKPYVDPR